MKLNKWPRWLICVMLVIALAVTAAGLPSGAPFVGSAYAAGDVIVDNGAAVLTGTWATSTYKTGYYGSDYVFKAGGTGTASVKWTPNLPAAGDYSVYYWLPDGGGDRTDSAAFTVYYSGGSKNYAVNEQPAGGAWVYLGTHPFAAGTAGYVQLTDQAGSSSYVIADAVKFVPSVIVDNSAAAVTGSWTSSTYQSGYYGANYLFKNSGTGTASVKWTPDLPSAGNYGVYYWLPAGAPDRATNVTFTVYYSGGSKAYTVNEQAAGGAWVLLGTHPFAAGTSGYVQLTDQANNTYVIADAVKFQPAGAPAEGQYVVRMDVPKQVIWGLGVEIQSDSIGSGNNGLPSKISGVPHDLVSSEKTRLYTQLLKGFRYVRLAMGLYLRGTTADGKNVVERYPGQMAELSEMIQQSGMEGASVEYWSPTPYWKSNNSYIGGSLKQFDSTFLNAFGDALVQDVNYLTSNGVPVKMWGLQNEPSVSTSYSTAVYNSQQYHDTFAAVAPKIKSAYPNMFIHANSEGGQNGVGSALIRADSTALSYVDGWTWHKIGTDSNDQITGSGTYNSNTAGKVVFNNEFEYLDGKTSEAKMMNTAQSIMNWMTFENSPTWFWLHALKPTYNSESEGYGLGLWRPDDDNDFSKYPNIQKGHFDYLPTNWHAVQGFLKYMPWNSQRYQVDESSVRGDNRIMAWKTPEGKMVVALTNRSGADYTFHISGMSGTFTGYRFGKVDENINLGGKNASDLNVTVPNNGIEFWVQN
ncbi:glycoside hydrolase family 30 beta sandwich domain-containing protein [Paenibacillus thalictri]|nr:glycoside hydrolase family 30 beta sandwich domain-containing protein [Paenibacillus thalictri]